MHTASSRPVGWAKTHGGEHGEPGSAGSGPRWHQRSTGRVLQTHLGEGREGSHGQKGNCDSSHRARLSWAGPSRIVLSWVELADLETPPHQCALDEAAGEGS